MGDRWSEEKVAEWLHGQPQSDITDHQVYYFKCLGAGPEKNRWLDGRTNEGTVGLVPITTWPYTGTRWRAQTDRWGLGVPLATNGWTGGRRMARSGSHRTFDTRSRALAGRRC